MKAWLLTVFLGLSLVVSAHARPNVVCSAADKGWEEHWGGHRTCAECLQKHGTCIETCSLEYTTCEAVGTDSLGNSFTVRGSGSDRWEAERNAVRHCERNFRSCRSSSCNSKSETVSRTRCGN